MRGLLMCVTPLRNLLREHIRDARATLPRALCADRWLLQENQILAASARAVTHANAALIPCYQVHSLQSVTKEMRHAATAQKELVGPHRHVTARLEYPDDFPTEVFNVIIGHLRERGTTLLPLALVAIGQLV